MRGAAAHFAFVALSRKPNSTSFVVKLSRNLRFSYGNLFFRKLRVAHSHATPQPEVRHLRVVPCQVESLIYHHTHPKDFEDDRILSWIYPDPYF